MPHHQNHLSFDDDIINILSAQPNTVATLSAREAELADLLARAGLEPRLAGAAHLLQLAAATRPDRIRFTQ
jgi:hypothetical protein